MPIKNNKFKFQFKIIGGQSKNHFLTTNYIQKRNKFYA